MRILVDFFEAIGCVFMLVCVEIEKKRNSRPTFDSALDVLAELGLIALFIVVCESLHVLRNVARKDVSTSVILEP